MRIRSRITLLSVLLSLTSMGLQAQERVGDFALLDEQGYFHHMSWYDNHEAIVFLVQANGDAAVQAAVPRFAQLAERFADQGLKFFLINPMANLNRDAVHAEMQNLGLEIPVLMDDSQLVAETLGIERTAEVLIYDPERFVVSYRGSVDDALTEALEAVTNGASPASNGMAATSGTPIAYAARDAHQQSVPSYADEIAPIIAENCANCHREGGVAPFAMDSHTMMQGWSPMIREVILTKRMPPGQIDPHVGDFENDMVLTDSDAQKLIHWIDAGSPKAGEADPLAALTWPESEWAFGEPDLIINVPPQEIPATGVLDYYNVMVDVDLDEDRWVRASQYIPGDRTVLHHTLHSIIQPGETRGGSLLGGDPDRPGIAPYIPGQAPREELPNTGGLLKAGSRIAMQMHYTTNGRESVDESRIGVWFYPKDFVPEERMSGECACHFTPTWQNIPPNDPDYEMSQTITIDDDAYIYAFTPHMHFRGKRMRFTATFPDGTQEEMLNIANYDYNWQLAYTLEEPRFVPAGTRITADGAFDNSEQNLMNPDPARSVPWGLQSWDEMFFGAVDWKYVDQSRFQN